MTKEKTFNFIYAYKLIKLTIRMFSNQGFENGRISSTSHN